MHQELQVIWNQMRSDFDSVMVGFATQRDVMDRHQAAVQRAMEEQRKAMEEQRKAMEEQRQAMEEQRQASEAQGHAIERLGVGLERLIVVVDGYYTDHESRLCALENRLSA